MSLYKYASFQLAAPEQLQSPPFNARFTRRKIPIYAQNIIIADRAIGRSDTPQLAEQNESLAARFLTAGEFRADEYFFFFYFPPGRIAIARARKEGKFVHPADYANIRKRAR